MVSIPKEVVDVLNASDSAKMLATVDAKGVPNVVPVWSIVAVDSETIAFAEIFIKKTKENLEKNKQVAIAVFKGPMTGYQLKGTFSGFQTSGPVFDNFAKKIMEAMKMQIKSVGIIKVTEVFSASPGQNSKKLA
ncbi:MAG: pyridoxamine 5'-phosphate oxidase family protein [Candidatus Bathyarchaeia archaeon]